MRGKLPLVSIIDDNIHIYRTNSKSRGSLLSEEIVLKVGKNNVVISEPLAVIEINSSKIVFATINEEIVTVELSKDGKINYIKDDDKYFYLGKLDDANDGAGWKKIAIKKGIVTLSSHTKQ